MPISEPQKVRISPKAVNTLTSISPVGGTQKAEKISCAPKKTKAADKAERITVYVVNGTKDLSISYTSASTGTHQWYRYKTKRLEAEAVPGTQSGQTSTVVNIEPEYGYFVEEGAVSNYVWIDKNNTFYVPKQLADFLK